MVIAATFAARLVFGALISPAFLESIRSANYLFAVLMLVAVLPTALLLSFVGSRLNWRERIVAAWFRPKGFASVTFGLMILKAGVPEANELFHLCALVIFGSIVAHSSTDVVIARWFSRTRERAHDD
jgi:sodium/hydrogen antiporter